MVSRRHVIGGLAAGLVLPGTVARAQTGRVITTHISVEDNRVWIAATINGSRPYLFIIDTGCVVSLIEERVARELALRARGQVRLAGVGGSDIFALYEARDVAFSSGLRQPSVVFGAVARELALGRGAAGAFAAGLLTGADSDLDLDRGEWRLYPDGRGSWDGYSAIPSAIAHDDGAGGSAFVYVDAVLNDRTFRLLVDTGAPARSAFGRMRSGAAAYGTTRRPTCPCAPPGSAGISIARVLSAPIRLPWAISPSIGRR